MKRKADYHDYVFKKSKLIGRFEDMYKYSKVVPWHQDETINAIFSNIDIEILKQFNYDTICEIGCGLGYFSNRLYMELKKAKDKKRPCVTGIDISQSALDKAKRLFPEINFMAGDMLRGIPEVNGCFDLVVVKEVLWYVCHKLDLFLKNVLAAVKKGGFVYISQSFPESKEWVGREIVDSPQTLYRVLTNKLKPVYYCVEYDARYHHRPLVHFLGKPRERQVK